MSSFDEKILNVVKNLSGDDTTNPYEGKWVSILGDFCSTFEGYSLEGMTATHHEGFDSVNDIWWGQLISKLGAKLCVNASSASMRATGTDDVNSAAYKQWSTKLHREAGKEYINLDGTKSTYDEVINPDIIFVYLGTNDYSSSLKILLGDYSDAVYKSTIPEASTITGSTDVSTTYQIMLNDIMTSYPNATIYCISPQTIQKSGSYPFVNTASTPWSMPEFEELVRKLCSKFGARQIALSHYGIRGIEQMTGADGVVSDATHLTLDAHKMIAKAVYNKMKKFPITWNTRNDVE